VKGERKIGDLCCTGDAREKVGGERGEKKEGKTTKIDFANLWGNTHGAAAQSKI